MQFIPPPIEDGGILAVFVKKLYVDRFNPAWDSDEDADAAFADAAVFARGILMREIKKAASDFMAEDIIREAVRKIEDGIILPYLAG